MNRVAVLLMNLGGPETQADVRGFLYNLFEDRRIINLPFGVRQGLAAFISSRRAPMARANYMRMGGGSPILRETRAQAEALQTYIASKTKGIDVRVFVGMRYWRPYIADAAREIAAFDPDEIVLLPLYPQFSSTTTLTAFEAFDRAYQGRAIVKRVCCYANNGHFIKAHADLIRKALKRLKTPGDYRLLFSAHGLPQQIVDRGDPSQAQIEATVARVMAELGGAGEIDHVICYQSRVGRLKWLGPSTDDTIRQAGRVGKGVVVIPIAFVSEHIETLVELDIEYGELAHQAGVKDYVRVPALGIDESYIRALNDEVLKALGSKDAIIGDADCAACHVFCPKTSRKTRKTA
ncbi:MAG: ferrochelatase [Asticcacaulis sp.]